MGQALAQCDQIYDACQLTPVGPQTTASLQVSVRKVRLDFGTRESLVSQKVANIGKRRACNGELPVKHSSHSPISSNLSHEQIPATKIAVHQVGLVVQRR